MNWEAIGAVAELLAAIGVIVSLVYLASQIRHSREQMRQNTRAVEAQVTWAHWDSTYKIYHTRLQDPDLIALVRKIRSWDREQIDTLREQAVRKQASDEWLRAIYLVGNEFGAWQARFQTQTSPEERAILAMHIAVNGRWPIYLWQIENFPEGWFRPEFREFVLRVLRDAV